MISGPNAIRAIVSMLLLSMAAIVAQDNPDMRFHSLIPLGADAYQVRSKDWRSVVTLMASAESPQFEGMERRTTGRQEVMLSEDGKPIEHLPAHLSFRVTATYRARFMEASPFDIPASTSQNDYLLGLKFRVVVFRGLRQTVVKPESVEMIGVPGEMPYDERIFRVSVDLSDFRTSDRVVLEVHDPDGERICKFHLDLM